MTTGGRRSQLHEGCLWPWKEGIEKDTKRRNTVVVSFGELRGRGVQAEKVNKGLCSSWYLGQTVKSLTAKMGMGGFLGNGNHEKGAQIGK